MHIPPRVNKAIEFLAKTKKPGERGYLNDIPAMTMAWLVELGVVRAEKRIATVDFPRSKGSRVPIAHAPIVGERIYFYQGGEK